MPWQFAVAADGVVFGDCNYPNDHFKFALCKLRHLNRLQERPNMAFAFEKT